MQNEDMIKGVLFDYDGVIIDSSKQHQRSWEILAEENGFELPEGHFEKGFGMKNVDIIPTILGWTEDPEEIEFISLKKETIYRRLLREEGPELLPGVLELLEELTAEEVPCAIASSTERKNLEVGLGLLGLREYFSVIISGDDVEHGKPDPEAYLKAAEGLGLEAVDCVVFEDAPMGIRAGLTAGAKVVGIATTNTPDDINEAHIVISNLTEINWRQLKEELEARV